VGRAHHVTDSEFFNLSTALRQSSTTFVFDWMFYLPMAVLGVPPECGSPPRSLTCCTNIGRTPSSSVASVGSTAFS
jgi:hypothetical protein